MKKHLTASYALYLSLYWISACFVYGYTRLFLSRLGFSADAVGLLLAVDCAAAMVLRICDIEERIEKQADLESRIVLEIMDVIELLPAGSIEREIVEFRHIDCKNWTEIERLAHLARSNCFGAYNRGLDSLLEHRKIRELIGADRH